MKRIKSKKLLIPHPLKPGDTVGVIASSGPPAPDLLETGITFLNNKGFRAVRGKHLLERDDYLAGSDHQRSGDLNDMLCDPSVGAIMFARGGYGTMRLLERINREAIAEHPKILLGMSDVTALQWSLFAACNLVTLAGPMIAGQVAEGLDPISEEWLMKSLTEPIQERNLWPSDPPSVKVLRHGAASGVLIGGCLSLITALLGTGHVPDFAGKILLIEDINEQLYRIDRMLTQLKLCGALSKIAGVVLGHFIGPEQSDLAENVETLILEFSKNNPVPVISRFPHGHRLPNLTLPFGVPVEMNTEAGELIVRLH